MGGRRVTATKARKWGSGSGNNNRSFIDGKCARGHDITIPGAIKVNSRGRRYCLACRKRTEIKRAPPIDHTLRILTLRRWRETAMPWDLDSIDRELAVLVRAQG
jgi:hypothetical protein